MFFAKYILKDRVMKLSNLERSIKDTQEDIQIELSKARAHIYDIRLALEECYCAFSRYREYGLMINSIKAIHRGFSTIENGADLKEALKGIIEIFTDFDYASHYSGDLTYDYKALSDIRNLEFDVLNPILREFGKSERIFNVFEPNCSAGDTLNFISSERPGTNTYGIEHSSNIAAAKKVATKVVKGYLKGSRISNNVFDLLIAKCNIRPTLADNMERNSVAKCEKDFITSINNYLRPDGVVLFVIPYYRLHKDICEHIAKYYNNVKVFKSTGPYWSERKYVYIYGQKSINKELDQAAYESLRKCYNPSLIEEFNPDIELKYNIPSKTLEVEIFKGSVLDMEELHHIIETSNAMDEFFENQNVEKIGESTTRPLLPFNIGQLGLVLTSGCLDGIIDEGDGHYHLVKGKVSKKSETVGQVVEGVLEEQETISNRVEINILLPNGDFKTLS